jgi:hypothetical protein
MSNSNKCTLVTAFYDFEKKKNTSDKYYEWMENFLPHLNSYIIIFTDERSYMKIYNLRKNHLGKTKIALLPISDFYTYKYMDHWKKDLIRDHEGCHSVELYMIWNEKSMFVKRAIEINPFDTEYYCWSDIGMIRNSRYSRYIQDYPKVRSDVDESKMYLLNIQHQFNENDFNFKGLATERYRYINAIGGGVIFGHKKVFMKWIDKYYEMLDEFVKNDLFAGKDQSLMACIYVKNRDMINLVWPQPCPFNGPYDEWFYLVYYLAQPFNI